MGISGPQQATLVLSWLAILAGCGEPASRAVADTGQVAVWGHAPDACGRVSASQRARQIAVAQRRAGPSYHFAGGGRGRAARAINVAQGVSVALAGGVTSIRDRHGARQERIELRWTGRGRSDARVAVAPPAADLQVAGNRASWHRADGSEEWYVNGPLGLEQGFVLADRPPGSGAAVVLDVAVAGVRPHGAAGGGQVALRRGGETVATYGELHAFDAAGLDLATRLQVAGQTIRLVVDDAGARYPVTVDPLVWFEQQKLVASDASMEDHFGVAVDLSGDVAVIGNPEDNVQGFQSGSAYVFARTGAQWAEQAKLVPGDGTHADWFGWSVAVSGETVLVGAYGRDDSGIDSGAVYVFVRTGSSWVQQQKLLASDGQTTDWFGWSVALDGDTALIGAAGEDDNGQGAGAAYVFLRSGSTWSEQDKLVPGDGSSEDWFGWSVAVEGDMALVGAFADDDQGDESGSAYAFVRSGGSWAQQQKLIPAGGGVADWFGRSLDLAGDWAVIGALGAGPVGDLSGAAYVFQRSGNSWGQQHKLVAPDAADNDLFGWAVAVSGARVLVGAPEDDDQGTGSGSAYVFARDGGSWIDEDKLVAGDGTANDSFAKALAIGGRYALIAAPDDLDTGGEGSAYVFEGKLTDGEPCTADDECLSGFCVDGVCCDTDCDGGNIADCVACSTDAGGAANGVCGPSTGNPCDDGDSCTEADACADGACAGAVVPCPAADVCEAQGSCDPATGSCTYGPAPDGTACDDDDPCTHDDACAGGVCQGTAVTCVVAGECHLAGTCAAATGSCDSPTKPDGTPCSIGFCVAGECVAAGDGGGGTARGYLIEQRCGCRVPAGGDGVPWWLIGAVVVGCGRRRRRVSGT